MTSIIYEVHSDTDENNIMESFTGRGSMQAAIAYARRNREEQTWVDRVIYHEDIDEYEYDGGVWSYEEE